MFSIPKPSLGVITSGYSFNYRSNEVEHSSTLLRYLGSQKKQKFCHMNSALLWSLMKDHSHSREVVFLLVSAVLDIERRVVCYTNVPWSYIPLI